jgi:hypothetical protein
MTAPKKDDLSVQFKALGIPIIDPETPEQAVKEIQSILNGWDIVGKARAETELERTKVVIAKLVKDWVNPYAMEGREIPVVLFSTHPEWKIGTRLDAGLVEQLTLPRFAENYLVIVFDDNNRIRKYNCEKYSWE